MNIFNTIKSVFSSKDEIIFAKIIADAHNELEAKKISYWSIKSNELSAFGALSGLPEKEKVRFIIYAIKEIHSFYKGRIVYSSDDKGFVESNIQTAFYQYLLKTKLQWDENDVASIAEAFFISRRGNWADITSWPLALFINQIERNFNSGEIPEKVTDVLQKIKLEIEKLKSHKQKDTIKVLDKIETILFEAKHGSDVIKPTLFLGEDEFGVYANKSINEIPNSEKSIWYRLIALAQKASGSKPTAKYLDQSRELFKKLGADKFKKQVNDWFDFIVHMKEIEHQHSYAYNNGQVHNYTTHDFLSASNIDAVKGFVWMCSHFHDTRSLQILASLAERSFKKIPGRGPAAAAIGNACLFTLFKSKGLEGIGHLSRLKLRIKQSSTQSLIEKYLEEAAKQQGVTVSEIEDLAVDDFGLHKGVREYEIEGYRFIVSIKGVGDVDLACIKPDGNTQKSIPSIIKEKASDKLKKIKEVAKKIEVTSSAQRDRIDRMLRSERIMTWEYFNKHYFAHGLMSFLTKAIIWRFDDGKEQSEAIFHDGNWHASNSQIITPTDEAKVSLWHPVTSTVEGIKQWREYLIEQKIVQPIKQAFREVYILTDAEVNTRIYSNRMAAHIIRQHQFNSLAKTRGWKYALLGAYDDGRNNQSASLNLPDYGIRAEYWINEVNAEDAMNDVGIWNYVATDQVRFVNPESSEPIELVNIPKVPFSEVMRDVDLFVGVASVGNDPTWSDSGGVPAYRDYWQSYSFGELSEIAKNRKETLERLLPRLKIASVAHIQDRFLIIKGQLRTYKIHIGSTNILMEPNDQYLCIVPDASQKPKAENVYLPFEGDTGLSVVLSKALLLADDTKIKDPTIISQIQRK